MFGVEELPNTKFYLSDEFENRNRLLFLDLWV